MTGGAGGEVVQVLVLGVVQAEDAGEGVDDSGAGPGLLAAFQAGVVVDADPGEGGEFLTAQPRGAAQAGAGGQPGLGGGDLGAPGAQEPPQLTAPAALLPGSCLPVCQPCDAGRPCVGGPVTPRNAAPRHSAVCR